MRREGAAVLQRASGGRAELGVEPTAGKDNTKVHFNLCEEISTLLQQNMIEVSPPPASASPPPPPLWAVSTRAGVKLGSFRVALRGRVCVCERVVAQMKPAPTKRHKANA